MKTIAIDIRPLLAGVGGVPEYTRQIVTHLVRNHPEYFYVFFLNSFRVLESESFFSASNSQKAFFRCPSKLFNASLFSLALPHIDKLIQKRIGRKIDLFFSPNIDFFSFSENVPIVVTVHDVTFNLHPECFTAKQRLWHHMVDPSRIFHKATRCIAVSECTKRDMIQTYAVDEKKINVIPLGIDPLFLEETSKIKEPVFGMPKEYILTLGARDQRKNTLHVIRAYGEARKKESRMMRWKLVVLGGSDPLLCMREAVDRYGISDSVIFLDSVSSFERRTIFAGARVFVYASLYEGFGLPPVEVMMCETPVISAAHSSLSEFSGDGAYMTDPHHTASLSHALISCTLDDRVRAHYIKKGRMCAQNFSWDRAAKQTADLFSSLLYAPTV